MNRPRHAATQFFFGERVSISLHTDPREVNPERVGGTIRGWDSSNTHALVELDNGEQNYFPIQALYPEPTTAVDSGSVR